MFAFSECYALKKVAFYGDYFGEKAGFISIQNFNQIIHENTETCIIAEEESDTAWTYQQGCPIKEVVGKTEVIVINGIEFFQYHIIYDLRYYDDYFLSLTVNDRAFSNLPKLETVEFNSRFERFNAYVFENTPNLTAVIFPEENSVYTIVDNGVYSKDLTELYFYPNRESVTSFTVPDSVTRIHPFAFSQNSFIETIYLGENIEHVNSFAFAQAYALEEIVVSNRNSQYFSLDGVLFERVDMESTVLHCYPLGKLGSNYVIPNDVIYIANSAFAYNKNLEEVTLNNGLISIGEQAFLYTEHITVMDVPASVDRIGYFAFGRSGIETVIIRRSVVVDGNFTLNFGFGNLENEMDIYVPDDSFDEYYNDVLWTNYQDSLKRMSEYLEE